MPASLAMDAWSEGDGRSAMLEGVVAHAERSMTSDPALTGPSTSDRFVSSHGRNIPCDLHNEHVNKLFKEIANFTEVASWQEL